MDNHYQNFYKQAARLQHDFHGYTHQVAHDPNALALRTQLHGLTNDLARGRQPRQIETRIRNIQKQIKQAQVLHPNSTVAGLGGQLGPQMGAQMGSSPLLSTMQSSRLHNNFESMRRNIRSHPEFR